MCGGSKGQTNLAEAQTTKFIKNTDIINRPQHTDFIGGQTRRHPNEMTPVKAQMGTKYARSVPTPTTTPPSKTNKKKALTTLPKTLYTLENQSRR